MKPVASLDWRIQALRAAGVRSARAISAALTAEGYTGCSPTTIKRRLREPRAQAPTKPVARPVARPAPTPSPSTPSTPSPPAGYVADDDAIAAHVTALAELVDRRVDAAVGAELADPEALADRWANSAADAGWPTCPTCGQHVRPQEDNHG